MTNGVLGLAVRVQSERYEPGHCRARMEAFLAKFAERLRKMPEREYYRCVQVCVGYLCWRVRWKWVGTRVCIYVCIRTDQSISVVHDSTGHTTHRHLTSLVQNKLQRDASLNDEAGRYWAEIVDRRYQFDVAQREVIKRCLTLCSVVLNGWTGGRGRLEHKCRPHTNQPNEPKKQVAGLLRLPKAQVQRLFDDHIAVSAPNAKHLCVHVTGQACRARRHDSSSSSTPPPVSPGKGKAQDKEGGGQHHHHNDGLPSLKVRPQVEVPLAGCAALVLAKREGLALYPNLT